jgi:glycosyltransferase EpsD
MLKVLYVTTVSGTINAFLVPHINMLLEQGHQVDIACNVTSPINPLLLERGCKVFNLDFQRSPIKKQNLKALKQLKKLIKNESYDIVHTHTPVASVCVRLACRDLKNVKVIYTAHGFHFFRGAPFKNWIIYYTMEKICARWTDAIITMNEEDYKNAQKLKLKKPNSVFFVNGVGINLNKFMSQTESTKTKLRDEYGYDKNDFIIIYVGELSYRKNQPLLIKTIKLLKERISNIKLLLIGSGPLENNYKELVKELNLEDEIEFLGFRSDIPNLMTLSDVAASSSRQEGLPVNVMEAMATGLPLVVTDSRGNRDLVNNEVNGYIINGFNEEDFADAIEKIYKSKETKKNFGASSLNLIETYSQENAIKDLIEIYHKIF